jgi:hypothetical protein
LITKWNTIEAMIVLARSKGWKAHHMDMKTTFLNKHLHDEILHANNHENMKFQEVNTLFCRLFQALYGLNQNPSPVVLKN